MIPYVQKPTPGEADMGRPRTGQMPLQHFRAPEEEWGVLGELLGRRAHGTVRAFIFWFLRIPGARLPARPTREEIDAARERYAEKKRVNARPGP